VSDRLPSEVLVSALVRRVNDAGGLGVVRAKGDRQAGAILVVVTDRAAIPRVLERGVGPDGRTALIDATPREADAAAVEAYWRRRRERDPDLWVVELDVPSAERFAAETMLGR
jgi:hypothetical protein